MFQIHLPDNKWKEIESKIPVKIFEIYKQVFSIQIEMILTLDVIHMNKTSNIDIAIICFRDTCNETCDAVCALRYAYAALVWFGEKHPNAPLKYEAAHYGKFYTTDVTLRLYSAAEHISNFIIEFLKITDDKLKPYRKNFASKQKQLSKYMKNNKPNHKITKAIQELIEGNCWIDTMNYRNDWVHNQAPLIANTGIRHKRESMLTKNDNNRSVSLGKFEKPKYTIEEFLSMVTIASDRFVNFMSVLLNILSEYIKELEVMQCKACPNNSLEPTTITEPPQNTE